MFGALYFYLAAEQNVVGTISFYPVAEGNVVGAIQWRNKILGVVCFYPAVGIKYYWSYMFLTNGGTKC